jgi:hypothetical protein
MYWHNTKILIYFAGSIAFALFIGLVALLTLLYSDVVHGVLLLILALVCLWPALGYGREIRGWF